jgi:hypothetical protein
MKPELIQWAIYQNPTDYPSKWVVRRFAIFRGDVVPDLNCVVCDSLEEARAQIPAGFVNVGRMEADEPQIEEVWT